MRPTGGEPSHRSVLLAAVGAACQGLARRQYYRFYKLGLVGLACLAVFWLVAGAGQEEGEAVPPPAISSRSQLALSKKKVKEIPDFDYKYEEEKKDKRKDEADAASINEVLRVFGDTSGLGGGGRAKQVHQVVHQRREQEVDLLPDPVNRLNGVEMPAEDTVDWVAVGGADLFRAQPGLADVHNEFAEDLARQVAGLGEGGEPVVLEGHEAEMADNIKKTEAFNLVVSDKISYVRSVPDTRDRRCAAVRYPAHLPPASVIIIFTNEAWSPLIRTIWSVLNRSPAHLVHEIILVDDFSDKPHLRGKLERYIHRYLPSKVKLMRLPKREGLIRARLEGARAATGEVILYLDSHCECNTGWLEPLLARIKENPLAFVVPIIDVIDDSTLEYYHGNGNYFQVGGFTWSGHFTWVDIPQSELARRGSPIAPTRSPTMAGGLFAVARETFWQLGSYDEEMDVWGGENLEMSFRIWQCGGVLETIPCSRVGHIFRSFHPYTFPGNKDTHGINTARTVEVWLEDYKRLFYMHRPDLLNIEIGSLTSRLAWKEEQHCKPFSWFLSTVYPEKFVLDDPGHVFAYGRLRNPSTGSCLDNLQNEDKDSYELGQYGCHSFMAAAQFFSFSRQFQLRREDTCATVSAPFPARTEKVEMVDCSKAGGGEQEWSHTREGKLLHKQTGKCLDAGRGQPMEILHVAPCQNLPSQVWYFDHYVN